MADSARIHRGWYDKLEKMVRREGGREEVEKRKGNAEGKCFPSERGQESPGAPPSRPEDEVD